MAVSTFLNPRYSVVLSLQLLLLALDILCNGFSIFFVRNQVVLLIVVIFQVTGLVFGLFLLLLAFFNTVVFKAGLVSVLFQKFLATLLIGAVYLVFTIAFQIWFISVRWNQSDQYKWTPLLQVFYALHKLFAVVYYYAYKRAAMRLGNSQYYEDSIFLKNC